MIGLMRVKNEARWIGRAIASILPVCEHVIVMDDHSTDRTFDICDSMPGVTVFTSPFSDLNEARDKNWLLGQAAKNEWILMIDGDEILAPGSEPEIEAGIASGALALSFRIRYLWDREDQVRTDGVYGKFRRPSAFRSGPHRFMSTAAAGNFHCGNVPLALQAKARPVDASLLHFGYLHREDRIRKYHWYREIDGQNANEDGYRHMVQGDLPEVPAQARLRHAGPLALEML